MLDDSFGVRLPPVTEDIDLDDPGYRDRYYDQVRRCIRDMSRWSVIDVAALGIFSFQKIAMWQDLGENKDKIAAHNLCRVIAGDTSARLASPPGGLPGARELDERIRPVDTFHILDSDSSQHEAILAATRGASLIIDGPPGTGKSQTIANIIAESLATGKTVLFVSEKSAALEVVKRRLDDHGLGDFCLECHSHKANKKLVIDELGRCLDLDPEVDSNRNDELNRLFTTRSDLNAYVRALHKIRPPLDLSVYQVQGRLAEIRAANPSRCSIPDVLQVEGDRLRRITDTLVSLRDCRTSIENFRHFAWRGCRATVYSLNRRDDIRHHLGRLAEGFAAAAAAATLLTELGFCLAESPTPDEWIAGLHQAREASAFPLVPASWLEKQPRRIATAYVQLDRVVQDYQRVRDDLPEFSRQAIWRLDPGDLDVAECLERAVPGHLLVDETISIEAYRGHLVVALARLGDLRGSIEATLAAARPVIAMLRGAGRASADDRRPREVASTLGGLESLAREFRRLSGTLPEFSEAAVRKAVVSGLAPLTPSLERNPGLLRVAAGGRLSDHRNRLVEAIAGLNTLTSQIAQVSDSMHHVGAMLLGVGVASPGHPAPREVATALGRLDTLIRGYRRVAGELPEFSESALWKPGEPSLIQIAGTSTLSSGHLRAHSGEGLQDYRTHLSAVLTSLKDLRGRSAEVRDAVRAVIALLLGAGGGSPDHPTPRQVATALAGLGELASEYRLILDTLPEFDAAALEIGAPLGALSFLPGATGALARLLPHGRDALVAYRDHIKGVAEELRFLRGDLSVVKQSLGEIRTLLRLPEQPLMVKGLAKAADLFRIVARLRAVRLPWFDPVQREELGRVIQRSREDTEQASQLRRRLMDRLRPAAFDVGAASLASLAQGFESRWSRLSPRWWSYRAKAAALYAYAHPGVAELLADMRDLDAYHRRVDMVRQAGITYAAGLIVSPGGEPDWERSLADIEDVRSLKPLLKAFPALKDVLLDGECLDYEILSEKADELVRNVRVFRDRYALVGRCYDLTTVREGEQPLENRSLAEFEAWLDAECLDLEAELARMEPICRLLASGRDVALAELPARLNAFERLADLQEKLGRLATLSGASPTLCLERRFLGSFAATTHAGPRYDWSALSDHSRWLIGFLDGRPGGVPAPMAWGGEETEPTRPCPETLVEAMGVLRSRYSEFDEQYRRLVESLDLEAVLAERGRQSERSGQSVPSFEQANRAFSSECGELEAELFRVDRIRDLLADGRDVALTELPARLRTIGELADLRRELVRVVAMGLAVPGGDGSHADTPCEHDFQAVLAYDWSIPSENFRWLAGFLVGRPDGVPALLNWEMQHSEPSSPNIERLIDAVTGFRASYTAFHESCQRIATVLDLAQLVDGSSGVQVVPSFERVNRSFSSKSQLLEAELIRVDQIQGLLADGQDVAMAELPARLQRVSELAELHLRAARLAAMAGFRPAGNGDLVARSTPCAEGVDALKDVFSHDWSALSGRCRWLADFLEGGPGDDPLPMNWEDPLVEVEPRSPSPNEIVTASDELRKQHDIYRDRCQAVESLLDLESLVKAGARAEAAAPARVVLVAIEELSRRIQAEMKKVDHLLPCAAEGRGVRVADLPARRRAIVEIAKVRGRLSRVAEELGLTTEDGRIADADWSEQGTQSAWLLGMLDKYSDAIPQHLVQATASPSFRARLSEAVKRNEAVCTPDLDESRAYLADLFDMDRDVSTGIVLGRADLASLAEWAALRVEDAHRLQEWIRLRELVEDLRREGLKPILRELIDDRLGVDEAKDAVLARFYRDWLDAIHEQDEALRRFRTDSHERLIEEFRKLDRASIQSTHRRIRQRLLGDPARPISTAGGVPNTSELGILLREVRKKARHQHLRQLFAGIPSLLLRLKPCLMMSPLAVSTFVNSDSLRFDLVIFDEASQVRPHDAISAIYRGRQLIVAGDENQLPPTNFFERLVDGDDLDQDEEGVEDELADFDSILGVCGTLGLPRRRLRWHYRSRREPLIAFSNRHIYNNELVTFPSIHDTSDAPAVRLEYVPEGRWKSGASGGFNAVEARRTAELVLAHYRENPDLSLGVITFSQRQQMAILDELERSRGADPSMEEFFSESVEAPFFVKNLENVQGDERDVIILSVGYGPGETGRIAMRFGPLNQKGGERRLNVAVTRARLGMTVVSSIRASDLDLTRTRAAGAKLLRDYLDFAERGVVALWSEVTGANLRDFDSPFECEVARALEGRGLVVHRQVGCGGFRIDLALAESDEPGRYVLGIECDGATYHSSATARDRDRLRQEVLEGLGWRICRVWSTDWIRDPASQVERVMAAFARAKASPPSSVRARISEQPEVPKREGQQPAKTQPARNPLRQDSPGYKTIDEVPRESISELVLDSLGRFGATDERELVQTVTRRLGFLRMGNRIKTRLDECVADLIRDRKVVRTDEGSLRTLFPDKEARE